ncbi:MAG: 1-(5-phosphoribosyl)-5-[(5-phosphoribosylamino)methylideneamino]imidazole-4-carboxamide isomerase [Cytophagales bacterium]|nr:1-(5-phosphoribosyl)-5-[(5-phosphoribosylamino)methylideneamino]imidazole-4-carboxamide isomerase [Cytophagales bacterium]MDW8384485.1 1-(5-phosphoribosyl)-5-[(5-phosphoribosylamino)methylideneamino]imidazole-4-carboxamide isomerase [Flammeovirgaceae bacterium]
MSLLIPAIDIIEGKCVRLTKGDYTTQKIYSSQPLSIAKSFEDIGVKRIHLVDLEGAKQKKIVNLDILEEIASKTSLLVDFGGGIQSTSDLESVWNAGAYQVTCGSIAVINKPLFVEWVQKYGPEKFILAADVRNEQVAINGWQENSQRSIYELIEEYKEIGIEYVLCTDIAKDGMLSGPSVQLYKRILSKFPHLKLIASGGVRSIDDLLEIRKNHLFGVVFGKAFYEGKITLESLKQIL